MISSNAVLEINTKNLAHNFKLLAKIANKSLPGATIKANAYGIGDIEAFNIFYKNRCRHFFLATVEEALAIRNKTSRGNIYVLNGLEDNNLNIFYNFNIIPILNSINEVKKFIKSKFFKKKLKIGIHVDTGINRLGIKIDDLKLIQTKELELTILISHLASADDIDNPYSETQNKYFKSTFKYFKSIKYKSLANSAAILNNKNFHYDIIRPGISLYGGNNNKLKKPFPLKPVINLKGKILQIKTINKNEYVGYNQTYKTKKKTTLAIIGIGYGDGIFRILSNIGNVKYNNETFNIIGRISMDSITVDISKSKSKIETGQYMEIINEKNDIESLARKCGTISNEILTSISKRVRRIYI